MFGRQGGIGGSGNSSNLIEFRAGRMNLVGKMVHPDARKGLVYLTQSEDSLMHFCWKDRTTGKVEDDLIVFPDDFEFKRVEQCKTGRVYVLKCKTSTRRMFFWMQEPKTDKDEELCRRVNELMNNPPPAHQRGGSDNNDLQYMLNNMSQQQLMQLFGGVGQMGGLSSLLGSMNSRTPSSRNSTTTTGGVSTTSVLQTPENTNSARTPSASKSKNASNSNKNNNSNSSAGVGSSANGSSSSNTAGKKSASPASAPYANPFQAYLSNLSPEHGAGRSLNIDLSTALTGSEAINQLISDPERVRTLSVHLPESEDADQDRKQQIKDHISSPQFQQALSQFSNALQSAQLGPVVSQFELPPEAVAAAYSGNLEEFVHALEKSLPAGTKLNEPTNSANTSTTTAGGSSKSNKKSEESKEGTIAKNEEKK